ncbi:replication protein A 70 kDa DNA-binding subunit B-like [Primulina huaijiensis]|uniref:replication protein A 70 kDa DNA-binding subunit B-like n=1 Tax=Primulina huaijiensis TaxID=1492673 RepID=UPI003CC6E214
MLDTITLTLWDDLAFNEGLLLEAMETKHPVIAFFNMKTQSYQGVNQFQSLSTTGMLRNPFCIEAKDLISWLETDQNGNNLDMMYMEKMVSGAKTVTIAQLQKEMHTLTENHYYCLEGIISKIENKSTPWYDACQNYLKKITKKTEGHNCIHCIDFNSKIVPRYRLSLTVQENDLVARITLFEDIVAMLIGFSVQEFINKTLKDEMPEQYLQQLEEQNNVKHKFLFKFDNNVKQHNGTVSIIAEGLMTDKKLQANSKDVMKRKSTSASSSKRKNSSPRTRKARKKSQHNMSTEKPKIQSIDIGDEEKLSTFTHRNRKRAKSLKTPEKQDIKIKKEKL